MRFMKHGWLIIIILFVLASGCDHSGDTLFTSVDPSHSHIHFNNIVEETDSLNILNFEYMYNGGGIGLGDFNQDGLEDIYVAGNVVDNKLYINKGDMSFEDITTKAGVGSSGLWSSGIAVVDINADGWQDIYVCNTTHRDSSMRVNNLYINQGVNEAGIVTFEDQAEAYGLNDNSYSVNAAFFDYDNDQDLDVIIIVNEMGNTRYHSQYREKSKRQFYQRVDRLYENTGGAKHPFFVNVSEQANIHLPGFSLGVNISDINQDGWKDIYISNDFLSDDIIYINQKNGSFIDKARDYLKHTSHSAMGNDVVDINNDGYDEIIALDMLPEGNYRQKRLLGETNYTAYLNNERFGYSYQFVRNTLQLNNGISSTDEPRYSDISLYSGIAATDWSWTPLVADFDHDGYRDMVITNGFPRDVTDRDFIDYQNDALRFVSQEALLSKIPSIKISNYAYRNNGNLTFEDVSEDWGLAQPTYSNGAAYGDLDNDGDLDMIINNINDSLILYRNNHISTESTNALSLELRGTALNPDAIGSIIDVKTGSKLIHYEHSIYRGYLSSHSKRIHVGLGGETIEHVKVIWPTNEVTIIDNPSIEDQPLIIDYNKVEKTLDGSKKDFPKQIFEVDSSFTFKHLEEDFIDYNIQPLLPHKLSQFGPSLTIGDINGDTLDDIYVGGSTFYHGYWITQQTDGSYHVDTLKTISPDTEELGSIIADFDGDGDNDMFIATGSYEFSDGHESLKDQLFENQSGQLVNISSSLPNYGSNACNISAADYDNDGDIDILIGGRVSHGDYPNASTSYLLENTSKGSISFQLAQDVPDMDGLGMVTDALWTDYNNDGWKDLIVTTELGEINIFKNSSEGITKIESSTLSGVTGFWNSISAGDLDKDGDMDYVLGNIGRNTYYPITLDHPYRIYVNDFDKNSSEDALPFVYLKDRKGELQEFPFSSRMDFAKEINAIRKMLPSYDLYAQADRDQLITTPTLRETKVFEANYPYSSILWNQGSGNFELEPLPDMAQLAPVYGSLIHDVNEDGHADIILVGNDYGTELVFGRMDAMNGLVLIGDAEGNYRATTYNESGFYVPDDGKSLTFINWGGQPSLLSGSNKSAIKKHDLSSSGRLYLLESDDFKVTYTTDEQTWISEHPYGQGFLSQSSRHIVIPSSVSNISIEKSNGEKRTINL